MSKLPQLVSYHGKKEKDPVEKKGKETRTGYLVKTRNSAVLPSRIIVT
jgi:hypothetical protein